MALATAQTYETYTCLGDDSNLFSLTKLYELEKIVNEELKHVNAWLSANKVLLNFDKSNFILFHPPQLKLKLQ